MRVEIRADSVYIEGYVSAVGRDSRPISSPRGKFIEQILPKTFAKSLARKPNVELRFNHQRKLGSTQEGNLELYEDNIGLRVKCTITDSEVVKKTRNNELRGWSFGFYKNKDRWEPTGEGIQRRYLEDIELTEVSILDKTPAYIATSIEQRGDEENAVEKRSVDDTPDVFDLTDKKTDKKDGSNNEPQEKRNLLSLQQKEIEYLKLKGGFKNGKEQENQK